MAAPYNPPVKGEDFVAYIALQDMINSGSYKSSPTIASGDFKLSKDGNTWANLDITSSANSYIIAASAGGILLKLYISASDMNCDGITIAGIDQTSPKEWADFFLFIPTSQ